MLRVILLITMMIWGGSSWAVTTDSLTVKNLKDSLKYVPADQLSPAYLALGEAYAAINYDSGMYYCSQSLLLAKNDSIEMANAHLGIGFCYYIARRYDEAVREYKVSLAIFLQNQDSANLSACYARLGSIAADRAEFPEAIGFYLKALPYIDKHDHLSLANEYNNLGFLYEQTKEPEKAVEFFTMGIDLLERTEGREKSHVEGNLLLNLGVRYYYMGEFERAIEAYRKSEKIYVAIEDHRRRANAIANVGWGFLGLQNHDSSSFYFHKALDIYEELKDERGIAYSYADLVGFELAFADLETDKAKQRQSWRRATEYGIESIEHCKKLKLRGQLIIMTLDVSAAFKMLGEYENALTYYELHKAYNDSVYNTEKTNSMNRMNAEFDAERKELQIGEQKAKIEQQEASKAHLRNIIWAVVVIVVLLCLCLFFVLRLVAQRKASRVQIEQQRDELAEKNTEIVDSITYAKSIQSAILPPAKLIKEHLRDCFVYYRPKDIVAGDFYWLEIVDDNVYYAAADSTGHGVPGAMVSVICSNALSMALKDSKKESPAEVLDETVKFVEARFARSERNVSDGMDLALCKINFKTQTLEYAGANNPLWIIRQDEVIEIRADRQPIGAYDYRKPFNNHTVALEKGDLIYTFSDGFIDQFGGDKGKKLKSKPFKKLLLSIKDEPMEKQLEKLDFAFDEWRGSLEQIDDVCVIGVRI